jgi:hypothetical protein
MSQLTTAQVQACAAQVAGHIFGGSAAALAGVASATASVNWTDLQNAVSALDGALDTTLNTAVSAGLGADTVIQALAAQIPAPVSGGTTQQKTILLCYVLLKRAGLI